MRRPPGTSGTAGITDSGPGGRRQGLLERGCRKFTKWNLGTPKHSCVFPATSPKALRPKIDVCEHARTRERAKQVLVTHNDNTMTPSQFKPSRPPGGPLRLSMCSKCKATPSH